MKKLILIIFALIFCQITASSQPCLPEGITFETQAQIDNFQTNHPNCTEIVGDVAIEGLGSDITNLNGLNVLTSIGGELTISFTALTSLSGLDALTSIAGGIYLYDNDALTNIMGLEAMMYLEGGLWIAENDALESLTGLNALTSIGGHLTLDGNASLTNLTGLNNITSIGGWVEFWCCDALTSFTGLDALTYIGGGLCIWTSNSIENLAGLNALTSIGGRLCISGNYTLIDLTGLTALTSIGGDLEIEENYSLSSLAGLDNIENNSISSLYIKDNNSLSDCEIQSICNYLLSPGGEIYISNNTTGCNSQEEVEEACGLSVEEQHMNAYLSLFPNPAKEEVNISTDDGREIEEVCIYTLTGQQVLKDRPVNSTIDISLLKSGIYIVKVAVENVKLRGKLIVQ